MAVLSDGEYGVGSAASVITNMLNSFPNLRISLMVGIGGGAPTKQNDIRLGDVVMEKVACTATGVWLIQGKEYQVWKTRPHSFLWLCGISGSGKTILSSIILRNLLGGTPDHVGYFYFDFNDQRKRSLEDMLRSLLAQLYRKISTASQSLDKMCSSNLHGTQQPSLQQMQDTFKIIVSSLGDVFIVMDALDE
ncbi:hypothetical protein D6D26_04814, partial [Aureobasidium pullulans]